MKKTLTALALTAGALLGSGAATADTNMPIPTWPSDQQAEQGTFDDPSDSNYAGSGSYDDLLNIADEDGAHPGTMGPAGPAPSPQVTAPSVNG